jgi:hypothetical protein
LSLFEKRNVPVRKFNIEKDKLDETFDVPVSFEVAEHLYPWVANRFVGLLFQLSSVVVMSGATRGKAAGIMLTTNHIVLDRKVPEPRLSA